MEGIDKDASELSALPTDGRSTSAGRRGLQYLRHRIFGYDAFISYVWTSSNFDLVDSAHRALSDIGIDTFVDRRRIDYGGRITKEIAGALRKSRVLVVLIDSTTPISEWVRREVRMALESGRTLLPIDLDGTIESLRIPDHWPAGIQPWAEWKEIADAKHLKLSGTSADERGPLLVQAVVNALDGRTTRIQALRWSWLSGAGVLGVIWALAFTGYLTRTRLTGEAADARSERDSAVTERAKAEDARDHAYRDRADAETAKQRAVAEREGAIQDRQKAVVARQHAESAASKAAAAERTASNRAREADARYQGTVPKLLRAGSDIAARNFALGDYESSGRAVLRDLDERRAASRPPDPESRLLLLKILTHLEKVRLRESETTLPGSVVFGQAPPGGDPHAAGIDLAGNARIWNARTGESLFVLPPPDGRTWVTIDLADDGTSALIVTGFPSARGDNPIGSFVRVDLRSGRILGDPYASQSFQPSQDFASVVSIEDWEPQVLVVYPPGSTQRVRLDPVTDRESVSSQLIGVDNAASVVAAMVDRRVAPSRAVLYTGPNRKRREIEIPTVPGDRTVYDILVSPKGNWLIVYTSDLSYIVDTRTGRTVASLVNLAARNTVFSPDETQLVGFSESGGDVDRWEVATGKHLSVVECPGYGDFPLIRSHRPGSSILVTDRDPKQSRPHRWAVWDPFHNRLLVPFQSVETNIVPWIRYHDRYLFHRTLENQILIQDRLKPTRDYRGMSLEALEREARRRFR